MNPKQCECGEQGSIIDSRQREDQVMRRYTCTCGKRWSSFEMKLEEGVYSKDMNETLAKQYSTVDRDNIADKLIELAQGLLR
jgi:transcriptional regulator NrdR family protein